MAKYGTFSYGTGQKYGTATADSIGSMASAVRAVSVMKPATLSVPTMKPSGA